MPLTERENKILLEIGDWERALLDYESNGLQQTVERYIERSFSMLPEKIQQQFFSSMDTWLFYLHGLIQSSQLQSDAKERILAAGRIFNKDIKTITDLKQLDIDKLRYIAGQQIARHRFYSFAQGGLAGSGGALLLGTDIPAMAVINLRAIQLIALTYGFEVDTPFEMMASLKVFHTATLPAAVQKAGWVSLTEEMGNNRDWYFYEGNEEIIDVNWLQQPLQQFLKAMVIILFRKKQIQGIPLVSMAVGAGANYSVTKRVTEFANKYYQLRYLRERGEHKYE